MAKVYHNQSFLDVLLQNTGSLQSDLNVAFENNLSITDDVIAGTDIKISNAKTDEDILNYYTDNEIIPAFGLAGMQIESFGIGKMTIGTTFIVS